MTTALVVLAVLVTAALVVVLVFDRKHPGDLKSRTTADPPNTSEQLYGPADRPAGPDAEPMVPDRLGGDHRPPA